MNFSQTSATVILCLFAAYIILVNILNIPFKDLVPVPEKFETLHQQQQQALSLDESKRELDREYNLTSLEAVPSQDGGNLITNRLPDPFIEQAVYTENSPVDTKPSNYDLFDKEADFGSEQTNVSQFFASNPTLFMNDQRHNAYVKDVSSWNQMGDCMFAERMNQPATSIQAYNYQDQCGFGVQ